MRRILGVLCAVLAAVALAAPDGRAQGSFLLGAEDWLDWGGVTEVGGAWSGVSVAESEPNGDHLSADPMAVGDDYSGVIAPGGTELDFVAFTVGAGDTIVAQTVDVGGMADSKLYLYDSDGTTLLVLDDDGGEGKLSELAHTFGSAGTYYLAVGPFGLGHDGAYRMELRAFSHMGPTGSWAYVRKALEAVAPGVTRPGADGSVAVLGAAPSTAVKWDGGAAYHYMVPLAATTTSLSGVVTHHDTAAAMDAFLTDLAGGAVNPSILVFPGGGVANSMDATEAAMLVTHAATIAAWLTSGGGLVAHGDDNYDPFIGSYDWLPLVFPGATLTQQLVYPRLTHEGRFAMPAMEDADHDFQGDGYFTGHGLDVFLRVAGASTPQAGTGATVAEGFANDTPATADTVSLGDDYTGQIHSAVDLDYLSFAVNAGDSIWMEVVPAGSLPDTKLYLYDVDGVTQLAFDDDDGTGFLSLIEHDFDVAGTYYLRVDNFANETGTYRLETRLATPGEVRGAVVGSLPSAWDWLGEDLAGETGRPLVIPTGTLASGSPWTLSLTNAAPNSTAVLIVGLATLNANFYGGTLVPSPDILVPLLTDGAGEITFSGTLGAVPSGISVSVQYWIVDPVGPFGHAASNAFMGTTP